MIGELRGHAFGYATETLPLTGGEIVKENFLTDDDYIAAVQYAQIREQDSIQLRRDAEESCRGILNDLIKIVDGNDGQEEVQRPPQNDNYSLGKTILFGVSSLLLYDSKSEIIELNKRYVDNKEIWKGTLISLFFNAHYVSQIDQIFKLAKKLIDAKEKSSNINYYLRITNLTSALLTGFTIGIRARPIFQLAAAVVFVTCLFFMIYRSGKDFYEQANLSVSLGSSIKAAGRCVHQQLISIEATSEIINKWTE